MAKNQVGVLVVYASGFEELLGNVTAVTETGVRIEAREFGKQTRQEYFFPSDRVLAHSDEGEGFVIVAKETVAACYLGKILEDNSGVQTESGRTITVGAFPGNRVEIIYGQETPTSLFAKEGRRRSARFDTRSDKADTKKPKKEKSKAEKPAKSGKRR